MAFSIRKNKSAQASQSYLASVSDMMSGLLLTFIIALVAAMVQSKVAQNNAEIAQKEAIEQASIAKAQSQKLEVQLALAARQSEQLKEQSA